MKVLVIGSGGREHALCWKLRQSPLLKALYCAPGNPGIEQVAQCVPIKVDNIQALVDFAKSEAIDFTIVGPELPLSKGVVDLFRREKMLIFGPSQKAAQLESSKEFAKEVMVAAGVPTARYATVNDAASAKKYFSEHGVPVVFKADGLASGKGVFVCHTNEEASSAMSALFTQLKADRVVIEQFLEGIEVSYIVATNGKEIVPFAPSHDYKRIFDADKGPNTGGMGSVCPTPRLTDAQGAWVVEKVMRPVICEMERRGIPFSGFLYAGLMISPKGEISVLEFNARFGDPECQSIMRRLDSDLLELLLALAQGRNPAPIRFNSNAAVCLVAASAGYPDAPELGDEITGIAQSQLISNTVVFHAGTSGDGGSLKTAGGRVLSITATGSDIAAARSAAYKASDLIQFRGKQVRRDIGLS